MVCEKLGVKEEQEEQEEQVGSMGGVVRKPKLQALAEKCIDRLIVTRSVTVREQWVAWCELN